jgi:hypothetical protein
MASGPCRPDRGIWLRRHVGKVGGQADAMIRHRAHTVLKPTEPFQEVAAADTELDERDVSELRTTDLSGGMVAIIDADTALLT